MRMTQPCNPAGPAPACLEKARFLLLALQPIGAELVLLIALEVLPWAA